MNEKIAMDELQFIKKIIEDKFNRFVHIAGLLIIISSSLLKNDLSKISRCVEHPC